MNARERVLFEMALDQQLEGLKSDIMRQAPELWERCLDPEDPLQRVQAQLFIDVKGVQAFAAAPDDTIQTSERKVVAPDVEHDET